MGVLVERPDIKFFWNAPDILEANEKFQAKEAAKLITKIGIIFAKHQTHEQYGLALVHRHFDMTEKEILVETLTDDKAMAIAIPWLVNENSATPNEAKIWDSYSLKEKEFVVPQTWSFSGNGEIKAFEYATSSEPLPSPPQDFVEELFQGLKSLGLENMIGMGRIRKVPSNDSWEVTPEGVRANVTDLVKRPDDVTDDNMITVGWVFDNNGQLRNGDHCFKHCKEHKAKNVIIP